jgi:RNA recognition motif-containing protein
MSIDPFTGRNPSYCFVDFHSPDDAAQALNKLEGAIIRDRPLILGRRTPKPKTTRWTANYSPSAYGRPKTYNADFVFDRWKRDDARDHWMAPVEEGRRLWVGGARLSLTQSECNSTMRELFRGWNITAVSKPITEKVPTGDKPQYHCFVDFHKAEEARVAMTTLRKTPAPSGGFYKIRIADKHNDRKVVREQGAFIKETAECDLTPDYPAFNKSTAERNPMAEHPAPIKDAPKRDFTRNWRTRD